VSLCLCGANSIFIARWMRREPRRLFSLSWRFLGGTFYGQEARTMKKKTIILLLRIVITLLILSPIVPFVYGTVYYPRPRVDPPESLVGEWETDCTTPFGKTQVRFRLSADGTVEGTVGTATMCEAHLRRGGSRFIRSLGFGEDYVITGDLEGPLFDGLQCGEFHVLGFDDREPATDVGFKDCRKDGQPIRDFKDGPLKFHPIQSPGD